MNSLNPLGRGVRILPVGLVLLAGAIAPAHAQYEDPELAALIAEIDALSARFPAFTPFPWTEEEGQTAFLYGDTKGIIHHIVSDEGRLHEQWKSFPLEGTVREIFAEDLDGDGRYEIVAHTTGLRVYVWETEKYELLWESVEENFEAIHAMVIADVDRDPAQEIVLCANNKIAYYDGIEFFREKEGRDFIEPTVMLIADVDNDTTDEIVTNDGYVIDTNSLSIEWATDGFGYPMSLFDIDDDGVPEVVGEMGGAVQFWDVEDQREIW
jgi:hypothetical protein